MKQYLLILSLCLLVLKAYGQHLVEPAFPHLIKYPSVRDLALSSDGHEAYITLQSPLEDVSVVAKMHLDNNKWTAPEITTFSGSGAYRDIEPFLAHDDLRLYFVSNRPIDGTDTLADYDIWFVQRESVIASWSEAIHLEGPVNTSANEFYPSLAENNNLYFTSDLNGKDDILMSIWNEDSYDDPIVLDSNINTPGYEFNAYVARDESYLLFTGYNRPDGKGSGDLYVSYRKNDSWTPAKNLNQINSNYMDYCPYVDLKTGLLFFTGRRNNIDEKSFSNSTDFLNQVTKYENGFSRIYQVKMSVIEELNLE